MTATPKILDKIAKLLVTAERGTENEARIAAGLAADLMARHQLEMADVVGRDPTVKVGVERGRIDAEDGADVSRIENWHRGLAASICEIVGGKMWLRGRGKYAEFFMIGPPDTVRTVRYMYLHLSKQIAKHAREAGRKYGEPSNAWRRSYALGMVQRVYERMRDARKVVFGHASTTAMVHVSAQQKAIDDAYAEMDLRKTRVGDRKRPDAGSYGYRDGKDVDLGSSDTPRIGEGQKKLT